MTLAPLLLNSLQLFKSLQWNSAKTQNQLTHVTIRSHLVVSFRQPFNMNHFLTTFNIKKSISTESKDYRSEHHKGFFPPLQSNEHKASLWVLLWQTWNGEQPLDEALSQAHHPRWNSVNTGDWTSEIGMFGRFGFWGFSNDFVYICMHF